MRIVSRTPQARSCCTTLRESYLVKTNTTKPHMNPENSPQMHQDLPRSVPASAGENIAGSYALKWELFIVGLDAADVVWRGGVQRLHQQGQRAAELRATAKSVRNRETRRHLWRAETLSKHGHLISH